MSDVFDQLADLGVPSLNGDSYNHTRAYTIEQAELMSGGMDCRRMEPTSTRPNCDFLTCQIGKIETFRGEPVFEPIAFGASWNAALHMLAIRGKRPKKPDVKAAVTGAIAPFFDQEPI